MAAAPSMLCPVIVGRDDEIALLRRRVIEASAGRGGVVVLVGDAGAGKSRLVREAHAHAEGRGMQVISGRAVAIDVSVPYRPLTEAFLGAFRNGPPLPVPELHGFEGHLGRLVPAWRVADERGADESPVLLREAVVRLVGVLARPAGAVLVIEDVHWADVETLAVIEYLADALVGEPTLCLISCRPGGALETISRLRRHRDVIVADLAPLSSEEMSEVVGACLHVPDPPAELSAFIDAHSDGNPFLAEELLAGLVASHTLVHDGGWRIRGVLTPSVPTDIAQSVRARTAVFDATTRRVLGAAAVLGRRFDWNLLPALAEVDGRTVVESLRRAVDAQLVEVDGHDFRFRHGLTREAVLGDLLPPERQELSRRAWPAIENAHPGLEGTWCELAAELAEASGDPVAAAERLVMSARRALDAGALATAQSTVERARALARGTVVAIDADECFVTITSLAGKPSEALEVGRPLAHQLENGDAPHERLVLLLVVLARAAVAAGDLATADSYIRRARILVDDHRELRAIRAATEAVAAHVALGNDDLVGAEELAMAAIEHAAVSGRPDVACEALEVLGRVARTRSSNEAIAAFERAAALADEHGLTGWSLRARQELALERWVDGDTTGLSETRDLAARNGAMVTVAVMDLSLADIALSSFERERCMQHATKCVEASRRYGLATLPVAELWLAGAHALAGDDAAMDMASARALERDPHDPRILGDLWGRVRATRSMVRDDREQLVADLDRMMEYVELAPVTTSIYPNRLVWVLLHSIDDDDLGVAARRRLEGLAHLEWWTVLAAVLDLARAVTLGRQERGAEAALLAAQGLSLNRQAMTAGGTSHYIHLLVAEAQIRDGWGGPAELLRPAEAFFADRGYDAIARRCRVALGRAGEKMPRRGRGASVVPEHLRAVGITSRELDVLSLVVDGCSNREIAKRLHLSPKTVEHHVSSLFARTGVRSRTELAHWVIHAAN